MKKEEKKSLSCLSRVKNYHQTGGNMQGFLVNTLKCHKSYYCSRCLVTAHRGQEHTQPTIHDPLRSPSHEQDPRRFNALISRVLRAAPLMPNELMSRAIYLPTHEKQTTSKTNPQTETPHHIQARQPPVLCDICRQYGIISTVMIPAVSSGATWMLSLRNFLWSCKTQVQSAFATGRIVKKFCIRSAGCHRVPNLLLCPDFIGLSELLVCFDYMQLNQADYQPAFQHMLCDDALFKLTFTFTFHSPIQLWCNKKFNSPRNGSTMKKIDRERQYTTERTSKH